MSERVKARIRILGRFLFIAYMAFIVYFLFFSERYGRTQGFEEYRYNLTPFKEIQRFLNNADVLGITAVIINLAGNILAFVPFGALLPVISPYLNSSWMVTCLTAMFSLGVELLQLSSRVGIFDIDDILMNTAGGMAGYLIFRIVNGIRRKMGSAGAFTGIAGRRRRQRA